MFIDLLKYYIIANSNDSYKVLVLRKLKIVDEIDIQYFGLIKYDSISI